MMLDHRSYIRGLRETRPTDNDLIRWFVFTNDYWTDSQKCEQLMKREIRPESAPTEREARNMRRSMCRYLLDGASKFSTMVANGEFNVADANYASGRGGAAIDLIIQYVTCNPKIDNYGNQLPLTPPLVHRTKTAFYTLSDLTAYAKQEWE